VPRQRKKSDAPAILSSAASAPKRVVHDAHEPDTDAASPVNDAEEAVAAASEVEPIEAVVEEPSSAGEPDEEQPPIADEGPVHRPLIRAQLPRTEGQPPASRQAPEFTIRQPGGRNNRFRPRHQRGGGQSFQGNRSNGNMGNTRGVPPRQHGGRPPLMSHLAKRHGAGGRKRSK
jgi:hypothetical protein